MKTPWYLEDDFVHKTLSELMPDGLKVQKCPKCGGKVYSTGTGIKRDKNVIADFTHQRVLLKCSTRLL